MGNKPAIAWPLILHPNPSIIHALCTGGRYQLAAGTQLSWSGQSFNECSPCPESCFRTNDGSMAPARQDERACETDRDTLSYKGYPAEIAPSNGEASSQTKMPRYVIRPCRRGHSGDQSRRKCAVNRPRVRPVMALLRHLSPDICEFEPRELRSATTGGPS